MKWPVTSAFMLAAALGAMALQGCSSSEQYGKAVTEGTVTAISDILAEPAAYEGRAVRVRGEIITECPSGCWFELGDGPAVVYVDIASEGLAIPQRLGKKATVEGTVTVEGKQTKILGKGVEIR